MSAIIMPRLNYGAIGAINVLGLTSGLKLCLDAGDDVSLPVASATWNDLSGSAYHFNRGTTSGAEASDPSINGTAGGLSSAEYLGFDGGDWLTLAQANPAWVNNLHKNNAKLTLACWAYSSGDHSFAGTQDAVSFDPSFAFVIDDDSPILRLRIENDSAVVLLMDTTATVPFNVWRFLAASLDEASVNSGVMQIGATQETGKACVYSSPSSSSAPHTMQVGARGDNSDSMVNGSRMAMFMAWEGVALSATSLMDLFNITRGRFDV